ncbi:MAG TPA: xylulokinase, partial [Thermomicrobiales bacterium]|nr:xylulokinase [Thermomicrobiales bacterium]
MTWLGIDLGTSSVKVLVVHGDGTVVGVATRPYPVLQPEPGAAEQDPNTWWDATVAAIHDLGALTTEIQGIGLSGQMHGTVLLGADRRLLSPAIIWSDVRSAAALATLIAQLGNDQIVTEIGSPIATGFQAATLAWIRTSRPETWQAIRHVLLPKDWLRLQLTGTLATDPSDGASTGMFNVCSRTWSPLILDALGVQLEQLPPVLGSGTVAGRLSAHAAAALGLRAGIPVATGGADAPLAALASGIAGHDAVLATLSSGAQVTRFSRTPVVDPGARLHTFASPLSPERNEPEWFLMGATMAAGSALTWARERIFQSATSIPDLTAAAAEVPVGAGGLVFTPYLNGERTPHMDPLARGAFFGLTADHDQRHLTRAIIEGAVFALRDAFDLLTDLTGPSETVLLAGGAARSQLWRQTVADCFGIPVVPGTVADLSAVGAAILAATAVTGEPASQLASRWAAYDEPVVPIPANQERLAAIRTVFQTLYS